MRKLTTGHDSTLGNYRALTVAVFGADSPAVAFLDDKIRVSRKGADEEVLADEGQMVYLLGRIHFSKPNREWWEDRPELGTGGIFKSTNEKKPS